jgi:precorrin isomerase
MGAPYNNIDTKVEAALSEVITDAISAATLSLTDHGVIRTGIDDEITEENNVTCYVDAASESC